MFWELFSRHFCRTHGTLGLNLSYFSHPAPFFSKRFKRGIFLKKMLVLMWLFYGFPGFFWSLLWLFLAFSRFFLEFAVFFSGFFQVFPRFSPRFFPEKNRRPVPQAAGLFLEDGAGLLLGEVGWGSKAKIAWFKGFYFYF